MNICESLYDCIVLYSDGHWYRVELYLGQNPQEFAKFYLHSREDLSGMVVYGFFHEILFAEFK